MTFCKYPGGCSVNIRRSKKAPKGTEEFCRDHRSKFLKGNASRPVRDEEVSHPPKARQAPPGDLDGMLERAVRARKTRASILDLIAPFGVGERVAILVDAIVEVQGGA